MAFFLVCMSTLLFISISCYVFQLLADRRRRLPPGPTPLPLIGNLLDLARGGELPHRSLARLAARHGPLMMVRLGTLVTVVASAPSTAREVLQTHHGSLTGRSVPDAWRALRHGANSIFVLPPDRRWRTLRRIGTEHLLSARQLDGARVRPLLQDGVLDLLRRVSAAAEAPVEVVHATFAATMEAQWRAMFSVGLGGGKALQDAAREAVALSLKANLSDFFPALAAADLQGVRRRFATRLAVFYELVDEQIELRMRRRREAAAADCGGRVVGSREKDLLDVMLEQAPKDDGVTMNIDRGVMRTFLTDIFLATVDTISSTIEWAMAELLQHQDALQKLQHELRSVLGSKPYVEYSDVGRLPYLQAALRETLRLHPVVPLVPNEAERAVEIQGLVVPKGCTVLVNLWAVHRDAAAWGPDADTFVPERFLPRLEETGFVGTTEFGFIPFSVGPRACLGLPLATRMMHAMLGSLLLRFDWALPLEAVENGVDMSESLGLTMTMATPLKAIAKPWSV